MPFGLTNAPASFQNLLNDIISDLLDIFAVVYLDDIMVFSSYEEEHVKNLASVLKRLIKNTLFVEASNQSQILKESFTTSAILSHLNPSLPVIVEIDASDYALGAILSWVNDSGKHPIKFDSRKPLPAELNYEVHYKELLGIVWALKCWRAFLLSLSDPFKVFPDHSSLQYFMSFKALTCCKAHWAKFLSEFYFTITYFPGGLDTLPDALSLWDEVYTEKGVDSISNNPQNVYQVLKKDEIHESRFSSIKAEMFSDVVDKIQKEVCHDSPLTAHPGQENSINLIKRDFHWDGTNHIIKDYLSSFQQFSRNKKIHHKNFGLLKPLQTPSCHWNSLSIDFITQFPLSNHFDSILVLVDRFSNMEIFIPTYSTITSFDLAQIFIIHVFSKHGLPVSIVSDRDFLFFSSFWTQLCQKLNILRDISTSFHPETNVQTERLNHILEQYLWMYVGYHQDNWNIWLPLAKFSYNNEQHSLTKHSPFFTIYGRNTSFDSICISHDTPAAKLSINL
ncbi:hypothetical protein O181_045048 [Austropuccinia psidii MF-1]|uniref:Integrase catalytic domain-containing protein n=1 Tax=Austropuccinia psidii MF-1 TaxID=1389203 RepID=A0A9Q3DRA2_9BASI|nr:hypothetical protein [Austropuccinia psidii MF-1]